MSIKPGKEIAELDPWKVKIFIHRERSAEPFDRFRENVKRNEQFVPAAVIDIRDRPREERLEDGRLCDYRLIVGEGRLLIARANGEKFRAMIEEEKAGSGIKGLDFFLLENLKREPLPWAVKARLIKPQLDAGKSPAAIAKALNINRKHVLRMHRILNHMAPELEGEVSAMPMNDAEVLTSMKPAEQKIVMEIANERGTRDIQALVNRAKKETEKTDTVLTKRALDQSLKRLDEDLKRMRDKLRLSRMSVTIGPDGLRYIRDNLPDVWKEIKARKINVSHFDK